MIFRRTAILSMKESYILHCCVFTITIVITMMQLNHMFRKYTGDKELIQIPDKINYKIKYMDDIKLCAKYKKKSGTQIQAERIYSQDIEMQLIIIKCTRLIMRSRK